MRATHIAAVLGLAAAGCLAPVHESDAARIYDSLNYDIDVYAYNDALHQQVNKIHIAKGQRSDSLGWDNVTSITVEGVQGSSNFGGVCVGPSGNAITTLTTQGLSFNWFPHAQLQGGNYLVIGQRGTQISCALCDAGHNVMASSGSDLTKYSGAAYKPFNLPYNSQYYGC